MTSYAWQLVGSGGGVELGVGCGVGGRAGSGEGMRSWGGGRHWRRVRDASAVATNLARMRCADSQSSDSNRFANPISLDTIPRRHRQLPIYCNSSIEPTRRPSSPDPRARPRYGPRLSGHRRWSGPPRTNTRCEFDGILTASRVIGAGCPSRCKLIILYCASDRLKEFFFIFVVVNDNIHQLITSAWRWAQSNLSQSQIGLSLFYIDVLSRRYSVLALFCLCVVLSWRCSVSSLFCRVVVLPRRCSVLSL